MGDVMGLALSTHAVFASNDGVKVFGWTINAGRYWIINFGCEAPHTGK